MTLQSGNGVLVVREPALGLRAAGALLALLGGAMLAVARAGGGGAVVLGAAMLLAGGAMLAVLPRVHTAVFDRARDTLFLCSRGVLGAGVRAIPLGEVVAVEVEESTDSDGEAVHSLVVRLRCGITLPLVPSLCSLAAMHRVAAAACRFLDLSRPA